MQELKAALRPDRTGSGPDRFWTGPNPTGLDWCSVREHTDELVGTEQKDQILQLSAVLVGGWGWGGRKAANTPANSARRRSDKDGRDSRTAGRQVGRDGGGGQNDGRDKAE